jgi:hypothetical protein
MMKLLLWADCNRLMHAVLKRMLLSRGTYVSRGRDEMTGTLAALILGALMSAPEAKPAGTVLGAR